MSEEERRLRLMIAVLKVKRDAEPDPVKRIETQYEVCLLSQQIVTLQRRETSVTTSVQSQPRSDRGSITLPYLYHAGLTR